MVLLPLGIEPTDLFDHRRIPHTIRLRLILIQPQPMASNMVQQGLTPRCNVVTVSESECVQSPSVPIVRRRLPDTRKSVTHKFAIDQHEGYITVGFYEDGRPGEVFIKIAKHGSTIAGLLDTIAVLTSLALQYGVPVEALARKFEFTRFEPDGWTRNPELRHVHSLVDYIFRWLGMTCSAEYRNGYPKADNSISTDSDPLA